MILLAQLLKLKVQHDEPPSMEDSWYCSMIEHRQRIEKNLRNTPSLKSYLETAIEETYRLFWFSCVNFCYELKQANSLSRRC
jgi:hypothetical protein